jgi:hypothetical protein
VKNLVSIPKHLVGLAQMAGYDEDAAKLWADQHIAEAEIVFMRGFIKPISTKIKAAFERRRRSGPIDTDTALRYSNAITTLREWGLSILRGNQHASHQLQA